MPVAPALSRRVYSEAGDAMLRRDFPGGVSDAILVERMNALRPEGERLWDVRALIYRVRALKLYRPAWFRSEIARTSRNAPRRPAAGDGRRKTLDEHRQKPLPIELTLYPTKDGGFSMALLDAATEVAGYGVAWCDRETASTWGMRWAQSENIREINTKRKEYALPEFRVSER